MIVSIECKVFGYVAGPGDIRHGFTAERILRSDGRPDRPQAQRLRQRALAKGANTGRSVPGSTCESSQTEPYRILRSRSRVSRSAVTGLEHRVGEALAVGTTLVTADVRPTVASTTAWSGRGRRHTARIRHSSNPPAFGLMTGAPSPTIAQRRVVLSAGGTADVSDADRFHESAVC